MAFHRSRYTLAEICDDGRGILINTLSGAVDYVSTEVVDFVKAATTTELERASPLHATLIERGYYVDSREVEDLVARSVANSAKKRARESADLKYMFFLTLRCNLSCSYCWQVIEHGGERQKTTLMSDEMVDAAFNYIDREMEAQNKKSAWISLFGGEPLMDLPDNRRLVHSIGDRTKQRGLHLHFTTNGKQLHAYQSEIRKYKPSIQVTIDGVSFGQSVELYRAGQRLTGLFDILAQLATEGNTDLYLRFLVSKDSVREFSDLADVLFEDPRFAERFTLSVAPIQNKSIIEDPSISPKFEILFSLMNALKGKKYTHRIAYTDWRSLNLFSSLRAGREFLPPPLFFHCEANINLTCFDQNGKLSACYEGAGNSDFTFGTYYTEPSQPKQNNDLIQLPIVHANTGSAESPGRSCSSTSECAENVRIDQEHLSQFRDRSAFAMPQCSECAMSPICGGGCQVRGYKKNGAYMFPYCDALHAETQQTMRHWHELSDLLIEGYHASH